MNQKYGDIVKEDKWLEFKFEEAKTKTKVYSVVSKWSQCILGEIRWYPSWRNYCFFPNILIETVHSDRCLLSISQFITELNLKQKSRSQFLKSIR